MKWLYSALGALPGFQSRSAFAIRSNTDKNDCYSFLIWQAKSSPRRKPQGNPMNQRQIEAFRLVMLRGSMTAAAEELGTSQPSISRLISELEASTGLALLPRNGGRIRATDAGSAFYREVDRSFVGIEKLAHS